MPDFDLTAQGFRLPHVFTKRRRTKITTPGYLIHRAEENTVVDAIKQGADVILLSSDIADGKTILAL